MLRFNSERKKTWIERVERQKHTLRDLYPFMENFPSPIWTRSVLQEAAENVEKVMARKVKEPIIGLEVDERFQTYIWMPNNRYCGPDSVPSLVYERYSHIARNRGIWPPLQNPQHSTPQPTHHRNSNVETGNARRASQPRNPTLRIPCRSRKDREGLGEQPPTGPPKAAPHPPPEQHPDQKHRLPRPRHPIRSTHQHIAASSIARFLPAQYRETDPDTPPSPIDMVAYGPDYTTAADAAFLCSLEPPLPHIVTPPYEYLALSTHTLVLAVNPPCVVTMHETMADANGRHGAQNWQQPPESGLEVVPSSNDYPEVAASSDYPEVAASNGHRPFIPT